MLILIDEENFCNSLWFAFASGSQTFPRTSKSKDYYSLHIYRIFIGKVGELSLLKWLYSLNLLLPDEYNEHLKNALSIYYGQSNVDSYDINIRGYKIDVKTVPSFHYKYLIIPQDQWNNQIKDYYVAVAVNIPRKIFIKFCRNLFICSSKEDILSLVKKTKDSISLKAKIFGFLHRSSVLWEQVQNDKYCPEKKCVRVKLSLLKPIEELLEIIRKE